MKKDLHSVVVQVSQLVGYSMTHSQVEKICAQTTFESMKNNPVANYSWDNRREGSQPFLRKGEIGDWKNYLSISQSARLQEKCERLEKLGLLLNFE